MRPAVRRLLLLCLPFCLLLPPVASADVTGKAVVVDGDTLEIAGQRVRLWGIDAPEVDQVCRNKHGKPYDCGANAIRTLALIVGGQQIACVERERASDGTVRAVCRFGRFDIAMQMVQMGWALADPVTGGDYRRAEMTASAVPEGIWKGGFETPWDWRQR